MPNDQELNDEARKERTRVFNEAVERKRLIKEFKEHQGYGIFVERLETQLKARYADLVGFPSNLDKIVQNNYTCGEIAGIKVALEFADTIIENAQTVIEMEKAFQDLEEKIPEDESQEN